METEAAISARDGVHRNADLTSRLGESATRTRERRLVLRWQALQQAEERPFGAAYLRRVVHVEDPHGFRSCAAPLDTHALAQVASAQESLRGRKRALGLRDGPLDLGCECSLECRDREAAGVCPQGRRLEAVERRVAHRARESADVS